MADGPLYTRIVGVMHPVISTFPLPFRPFMSCRLDLPPLSLRTYPLSPQQSFAVVSTFSRCHLDQRERSQTGLGVSPRREQRDFSLRLKRHERNSKWQEQGCLPIFGPVISTNGRDLMRPSSAPRKASSATRDFSLRVEMTAGGGFTPFALPGTTGFLASLEMTARDGRNVFI